MTKTFIKLSLALTFVLMFISCNSGETLQRYFVDNQETKNFISQDVPISMLKIDESKLSQDQKEAYRSVKRLNFLGFKANEENIETLKTEIAKVKRILRDSKYNELMEFSDKGNKFEVKYVGNDFEADEVVIFGSSKSMGFGIVRILGNNMSPEKMTTLVSVLQGATVDEGQLQDLIGFFK